MISSTKETINGATSDGHQMSPSVRQQVTVAIEESDELACGELFP